MMHSPFDILAETYDTDFTYSSIGQIQRQQVWSYLHPLLNGGVKKAKILEINCGTGEDAIRLSRLGHTVTATDASELMIKTATKKAMVGGIYNVQFQVCRFDELNIKFSHQRFDIIISNFGGLNCIDAKEILSLSKNAAALLNDDGKLFFVIMSSLCVWEMVYYSLKAKLRTALRRQRQSVVFQAGNEQMPVFYYSPSKIKALFKSYKFTAVHPVGLFVPPSYLEKSFKHRLELLKQLARIDDQCRSFSFLSNVADHFCIIFQKKETV